MKDVMVSILDPTVVSIIPLHSNIGKAMRILFERLASWCARTQLIPFYIEDNIFNFYLSKDVKIDRNPLANNSQQPGKDYGRSVRS